MRRRQVSRLILMNKQERFLLLHSQGRTPEKTGFSLFWITPGGGLEAGENFEQALIREAWEEVGLRLDAVGPWVWTDEFVIQFPDVAIAFNSRYNFVRVPHHDVDLSRMLEDEKGYIRGFRWWSLDDMRQSDDLFVPLKLPDLLAPLAAGHIPAEPIHLIRP